jgi:hypothetical protein
MDHKLFGLLSGVFGTYYLGPDTFYRPRSVTRIGVPGLVLLVPVAGYDCSGE